MTNHECPYCGKPQEYVNDEGFSQDKRWEQECPDCGKTYMLRGWYEECYDAKPADCLNGSPHKFEPRKGYPEECFIGKFQCKDCGKRETRLPTGATK